MDIFAHGVWSYLIFYRDKNKWLAVLFGVLPDLLSFGIYTIYLFFLGNLPSEAPNVLLMPDWVWILYGATHSIIVATAWLGIILIVTKILKKKFPLFVLTYPLAILIDIPLHSREFLPTPFLWPISDWHFPGFSWGSTWFMTLNYSLIILVAVWLYTNKHKRQRK